MMRDNVGDAGAALQPWGEAPPSSVTVTPPVQAGLVSLLLQSAIHIETPCSRDQSWFSDTGYSKRLLHKTSRNLRSDSIKVPVVTTILATAAALSHRTPVIEDYLMDMISSRRRTFSAPGAARCGLAVPQQLDSLKSRDTADLCKLPFSIMPEPSSVKANSTRRTAWPQVALQQPRLVVEGSFMYWIPGSETQAALLDPTIVVCLLCRTILHNNSYLGHLLSTSSVSGSPQEYDKGSCTGDFGQ
ncbi:hypothetical protein V8C26DRAFT_185622 [Trichoderma gracile]